jgi:hypothetical protein
MKLMLHHPFVSWDNLLTINNNVYKSFPNDFQACQANYTHLLNCYTDLPKKDKSDKEKNKDKNKDNVANTNNNAIQAPFTDFKAFARQRPGNNNDLLNDLLNALGTCEIDRTYD